MGFKGTKGKWIFDKNKNAITNESVSGLLATAWCTYNSDEIEQRQDGESWLSMRKRTKSIREEKEIEQKANALLISKAPEMLDLLQSLVSSEMTPLVIRKQAKQLIKEATEL